MKLFKRIYYPIISALVVIMLVFSVLTTRIGFSSSPISLDDTITAINEMSKLSYDGSGKLEYREEEVNSKLRSYIEKSLTDNGVAKMETTVDTSDGRVTADYRLVDSKPSPTLAVVEELVSERVESEMGIDKRLMGVKSSNIIVSLPGTTTIGGGKGDAVIFETHYDKYVSSAGSMSAYSSVASMISNIKHILSSKMTHENDFVFLFTDGYALNGYGAFVARYDFKGFDNVMTRAKFGASFLSNGDAGTYILKSTTSSQLGSINGSAFSSSAVNDIITSDGVTSSDIFKNIPSVVYTNIAGSEYNNSVNDTTAKVNKSVVNQQLSVMNNIAKEYANGDLDNLNMTNDGVYFSYLNMFTISFGKIVSYIIGGIMLALAISIFIVNAMKKSFSVKAMIKGGVISLVTILASALALYVLYYALALLLAGFGVIPLYSIGSLMFSNSGIFVSALLLTIMAGSTFVILLKKAFFSKAVDVVRGNVMLTSLVAIILSFALPSFAYIFSIIATLELIVMLVTTCVKNSFKKKFSMDIERLFLWVIPMILCMPIVVSAFAVGMSALSSAMLPVLFALLLNFMLFLLPYIDYTKPVMEKVFMKLPMHTQLTERTITERVEDPAKKGKFTEQTSKKVVKEKINWRYRNRVGITALSLVSAVMLILFSSFGASFGANVSAEQATYDSIYDNALVFVHESENGATKYNWEIKDQIAYKYYGKKLNGYKWNSSTNSYLKVDSDNTGAIKPASAPSVTEGKEGTYAVKTYNDNSQVTIKLLGASSVTKVTAKSDVSGVEIVRKNTKFAKDMTLVFPYGYGSFSLTIEGGENVEMIYTESCIYDGNISGVLGGFTEWEALNKAYVDNSEISSKMRGGILFRIKQGL